MKLPASINPIKLADKQATLEGVLSLASMSRLMDLVASPAGETSIKMKFGRDSERRPFIDLTIETHLTLRCERCFENFDYPLSIKVSLSPVFDDNEASKIQDYYEPLLMENEQVILQDIVEDEILLNLPIIAKHTQNACPVILSQPEDIKSESPFAILSKLKIKKEE